MRWAVDQDLKVIFLPFLGAAVSGRHEQPTAQQELVVLFAGPLPGRLLSLLAWGLQARRFGPDQAAAQQASAEATAQACAQAEAAGRAHLAQSLNGRQADLQALQQRVVGTPSADAQRALLAPELDQVAEGLAQHGAAAGRSRAAVLHGPRPAVVHQPRPDRSHHLDGRGPRALVRQARNGPRGRAVRWPRPAPASAPRCGARSTSVMGCP